MLTRRQFAAAALAIRERSSDKNARLRAAVAAYKAAAAAGRGFDSGLTRTNLRSRAQALLTDIAVGDDRTAALVAFVDRVGPEEAAALRAALQTGPAPAPDAEMPPMPPMPQVPQPRVDGDERAADS